MAANMESGAAPTDSLKELFEPLYRAKIWMQLVGVVLIIMGIITALSIIGIVIAWVPIWAGIVLMQAAGSVDQAYSSGESAAAATAMRRLKTYFTILGVLMLIYIVLMVVGFLFGIGGMMAGMSGGMQMGG